jgi:hypothetical protein
MKRRYAMGNPKTLFVGDGISLSWPWGGQREVVEIDDADFPEGLPPRVRARIAEGSIVEVDLPVTNELRTVAPQRLYEGEEARAILAQPPTDPFMTELDRLTGQPKQIPMMAVPPGGRHGPAYADPVESQRIYERSAAAATGTGEVVHGEAGPIISGSTFPDIPDSEFELAFEVVDDGDPNTEGVAPETAPPAPRRRGRPPKAAA